MCRRQETKLPLRNFHVCQTFKYEVKLKFIFLLDNQQMKSYLVHLLKEKVENQILILSCPLNNHNKKPYSLALNLYTEIDLLLIKRTMSDQEVTRWQHNRIYHQPISLCELTIDLTCHLQISKYIKILK